MHYTCAEDCLQQTAGASISISAATLPYIFITRLLFVGHSLHKMYILIENKCTLYLIQPT